MTPSQSLEAGTLLRGDTYRIERTLGQGGFGITYLATDTTLDMAVAIKEYFPKNYCDRDNATSRMAVSASSNRQLVDRYKLKFLKEARLIAKFNHPNIIRIHAAFESNDTAYYVMDYIDGLSLAELVRRDGPLSEEAAFAYIRQVGDALSYIHSHNINHFDIKPSNIMLDAARSTATLIDFGLSKRYDADGGQTSTTPVGVSHGFAPIEQYNADGVSTFSPQTDIYSLGATLYFLLSGVVPLAATKLSEEDLAFPPGIRPSLTRVIGKAMEHRRKDRYAAVADFLRALDDVSADDGPSHYEQPQTEPSEETIPFADTPIEGAGRPSTIPTEPPELSFEEQIRRYMKIGAEMSDDKRRMKITVRGITFDMVRIDEGYAILGTDNPPKAPIGFQNILCHNTPRYRTLLKEYWIADRPVTLELWIAVMGGETIDPRQGDLPIYNKTYTEMWQFTDKLNKMMCDNGVKNVSFRLPTEEEWEFAARGADATDDALYSGGNDPDSVAWYVGNSQGKPHLVARRQPNKLGLYDMCGNVCEMTSSVPKQSSLLSHKRLACGGAFKFGKDNIRVTSLYVVDGDKPNNITGFRLAMELV